MLDADKYEEVRQLPVGRPVMFQKWRSLLFMHFPCDPVEVQNLLPEGLTVDTFPDASGIEKAWVGLVPFRMEGIRRAGLPPIQGFSAFPETNVRTYVHRNGREPGVWFFSLDAANSFACSAARQFFKLPYHHAKMRVVETPKSIVYESRRVAEGRRCNVTCHAGGALPLPRPGSLDYFLVERYALHAVRGGRPVVGRVYHDPYPVCSARVESVDENLVEAAGVTPRPFEHILFSHGVDVVVYPLSA